MNRIIGHYEIKEMLGSGGIGQVYAGLDLELGREVAIKVLRPEFSSDSSFVERFRAEAGSLARLSHPNITTLYSLHREDQELFMIMELVHGQTLEALLTRFRRLGGRESLAVVAQTAAGLAYAHRMGVIHRDIKPANLMVTDGGLLKIMDFGIARVRGSQRLTREGSIVGTLAYVAPEQVKGAEGDERSDLYSLACVLYEMLCGDPPFRSDSDYEMLRAQVEMRPEPLAVRPQGLDPKVDQALMQGLAKDPTQRFDSIADFSRAIGAAAIQIDAENILRDGLVSLRTPPLDATRIVELRPAPPKPTARSRRPLILAAGSAMVAAVLGLGYFGYTSFTSPVVVSPQQTAQSAPVAPLPPAPSAAPKVASAQPAPNPFPQPAPPPPAAGSTSEPTAARPAASPVPQAAPPPQAASSAPQLASTQPAATPAPPPAPPPPAASSTPQLATTQPAATPAPPPAPPPPVASPAAPAAGPAGSAPAATDTVAARPQQTTPQPTVEARAAPSDSEPARPPGSADASASTDLGKAVVPPPHVIKGMVTSLTPDGWPVIDGQSIRLAGIGTIAADKVARVAVWIKQHGDYLSCEPADPGFRCLTQQNIDVAQTVLLNGAAHASADASPIYRAAEDQARAAHRGVWQ